MDDCTDLYSQDIADLYELSESGNLIISEGPFHNEPAFAPHLWQACLRGRADHFDGDDAYAIKIAEGMAKRWPMLAGHVGGYVRLELKLSGCVWASITPNLDGFYEPEAKQ